MTAKAVRTTCPYCGVGCGVIATPDGKGGAGIEGDPAHPANFGKLCSKGLALGETLGLETRVLHPLMRSDKGALEQKTWDEALDTVAAGFKRVWDRDGPDAIAFYLSGQLLTEDYYVANKLMKGFFGSANVDTNSRLCMSSSVAGHKRAFDADVVPGCYEDIDQADLIVLVGSNAAWCHPVLFQRMLRNKRERGAKIVVIDPRRTPSADDADLFLGIAPGKDAALFCGLLAFLVQSGKMDEAFVSRHTSGVDDALARSLEIAPTLKATARAAGLAEDDVALFFRWFADTEHALTCYSQGVNQSAQGTDKVNAIINCHLVTGRIGKPGLGPFSLTGQPNAMGGREVGGLANQLAAHMSFTPEDCDRVARFWNAPNIAAKEGLKAVQMFEAIEQGRIKALWVMGTNPVASLPRGGAMVKALGRLELFVVSDNVRSNDTISAGAHVLLPAAGWGEKDGTVTNSERRISRQRPFLPLPGEAKPDWWILAQIARRMGWGEAFAYDSAADIFAEHAALSAFENEGTRAFDLSGLANAALDFNVLNPFQWPVSSFRKSKRLFAHGKFFTPDGKARFIAVEKPSLAAKTQKRYPLRLNTGRLRDQWHTMTRTGLSSRLSAHSPEPVVSIHPADALRFGLKDGGFARVKTRQGSLIARASVTGDQKEGSLFIPIHWNQEYAPATRVSDLVAPFCDPYSGQPEAKATPCAVESVTFASVGFVLSRRPIISSLFDCFRSPLRPTRSLRREDLPCVPSPPPYPLADMANAGGNLAKARLREQDRMRGASSHEAKQIRISAPNMYAAQTIAEGAYLTIFACDSDQAQIVETLRAALPFEAAVAEYRDEEHGIFRLAASAGGRAELCFFAAAHEGGLPDRHAALAAMTGNSEAGVNLTLLLKGGGGQGGAPDKAVCACHGVKRSAIMAAIGGGCASVDAIGAATKAGTNCGSCRPEIGAVLREVGVKQGATSRTLAEEAA